MLCNLSSSVYFFTSDKAAAEAFAEKVEEASKVIGDYNKRLEGELKERQELQETPGSFRLAAEKTLKRSKENLKGVPVENKRR